MLRELVFVGGSVTGMLITDKGAGTPRATLDEDAIAEIATYPEYGHFGDRLRALGFTEDTTEGAPFCRWVNEGRILDVMPLEASVLGFSNRWYRDSMEKATIHKVSRDLEIRVVTAPYFLAMKIEAFRDRGKGDFLTSHDLEDLIFVVDGRPAITAEVKAEASWLREYLSAEITRLLNAPGFIDALPGYLLPDAASQGRIGIVFRRLNDLIS